jgi:hypothetical protein
MTHAANAIVALFGLGAVFLIAAWILGDVAADWITRRLTKHDEE